MPKIFFLFKFAEIGWPPLFHAGTALVVGNSSYKSAPLENPANDVQDIAEVLRGLGFEVIEKIDVSRRKMDTAVQQFYRSLNSSEAGLVPVDISTGDPAGFIDP
ncbi:MAG: caspase family protein [Desulfarculaceae bacterium]|nr:caspase family protein [Desulfarculaceae bacterium]